MGSYVDSMLKGANPADVTRARYVSPLVESETNHDFEAAPRFMDAMDFAIGGLEAEFGTHPSWNFHVLLWVASQAMRLPGDIVQCGVLGGTDAAAIVRYTNFAARTDKTFYLLDTFTGVPEELWTPHEIAIGAASAQWLYKQLGDLYASVVERFRSYPNVRVIQGKVPDTLAQVDAAQISVLFLDMNCAAPEAAACEYFWDKLVPGGIIFSDDYGHSRGGGYFYQSKVAFDNFAAKVGLEVLSLPTGQALLVKV